MAMRVHLLLSATLLCLTGTIGCEKEDASGDAAHMRAAASFHEKAERAQAAGNPVAAERFRGIAAELEAKGPNALSNRIVIVSAIATRDSAGRPAWIVTAIVSSNLPPTSLEFSDGQSVLLERPIVSGQASTDRVAEFASLDAVRLSLYQDRVIDADPELAAKRDLVRAAFERGELVVRARAGDAVTTDWVPVDVQPAKTE